MRRAIKHPQGELRSTGASSGREPTLRVPLSIKIIFSNSYMARAAWFCCSARNYVSLREVQGQSLISTILALTIRMLAYLI